MSKLFRRLAAAAAGALPAVLVAFETNVSKGWTVALAAAGVAFAAYLESKIPVASSSPTATASSTASSPSAKA